MFGTYRDAFVLYMSRLCRYLFCQTFMIGVALMYKILIRSGRLTQSKHTDLSTPRLLLFYVRHVVAFFYENTAHFGRRIYLTIC